MRIRRNAQIVLGLAVAALAASAQKAEPLDSGTTIRTETRLVLVDAVVTDKKGAYVHDLTAKDFRVWEDDKEQTVKSFSFEADPASPSNGRPHYLVLFFDNSTMDFGAQAHARDAASKFVEKNAGPDRYTAVVNYGGSLEIPQNFTNDAAKLQAAIQKKKTSNVASDASAPAIGGPIGRLEAGFGARNMILALRDMAKRLSSIPGRKILVLFTEGFQLDSLLISDATEAIDACNKANVAIYPIDARGLAAPVPAVELFAPKFPTAGLLASNGRWFLDSSAANAAFAFHPAPVAFYAQNRGGAGGGPATGGGGGRPGGGTPTGGGGRPSGGPRISPGSTAGRPASVTPVSPTRSNPNNTANRIVPSLPPSTETNQQLMVLLADGTGGFVIRNTNGLLDGLEKIGQEQNEYYLVGYTPPEEEPGCHSLRVKIDRRGINVRARTGYCNAKPLDVLAGNEIEKGLEARAAAPAEGAVHASMRLPYFYTSSHVARVNVALEIERGTLKFQKLKGKYHGQIDLVGLAYAANGTVAARFSDALKLDLDDEKQVAKTQEKGIHYENQFDIAPGQYVLKVAFSADGANFGQVETPLTIDAYREGQFGISGLALSREARPSSEVSTSLDAMLLEDRVPLIAQGMQLIPTGDGRFKRTDPALMYFEIYEPLMANRDPQHPFKVAMRLKISDRKTGELKKDSGLLAVELPEKDNNPVLAAGIRLPIDSLSPGSYTVEIIAGDSAGRSATRSTEVEIE